MGTEDARNMLGFMTKINFGYLMHLVGYSYEIYHDAWSPEHKILVHIYETTRCHIAEGHCYPLP